MAFLMAASGLIMELLGVMQAQQQRVCPPIFQGMGPERERCMERLPSVPVQNRAADPDWVPSQLARACSEGGEANQGRCKCGEPLLC